MNYWLEAVESSFDEHGIAATPEQMQAVAKDMEIAVECRSLAYSTPPNPLIGENRKLATDLKREREKVHCKECNGEGRITVQGLYHSSNSECWKCRGEGRHTP